METLTEHRKHCTKCGEEKSIAEFHRDSRQKNDGRKQPCRSCICRRERNRYHANPEKARAASNACSRKWRLENPEKAREASRKWRLENPEKAREADRKRRLKNPGWHIKNPDKNRASSRANARKWRLENPEEEAVRPILIKINKSIRRIQQWK